jgi:hypothetical protein
MSRPLFSKGARGEIIKDIQSALKLAEPQIDGKYGKITADAVTAFQRANHLTQTGEVDSDTWGALMRAPIPGIDERALQLTAAFEGHGFALAQGNFDGAGITWGIIGFTLKGGELGKMIDQIESAHPGMVLAAFGDLTGRLFSVLHSSSAAEQIAFADSISLGKQKAELAEPWLSAFRRFGEQPEVQKQQLSTAHEDYFQPALATARRFGLKMELGIALAFDIHVQNGGISDPAERQIRNAISGHPSGSERDLRTVIANAVADHSNPDYRQDVRERKLTIATGEGQVHQEPFVLRSWGLAELPI